MPIDEVKYGEAKGLPFFVPHSFRATLATLQVVPGGERYFVRHCEARSNLYRKTSPNFTNPDYCLPNSGC